MIIEPGDKNNYKNNSNVLIDNSENFFFIMNIFVLNIEWK